MAFDKKDLPKNAIHLPEHAKTIYREAFHHALKEYQNPKERRDPTESKEAVAHKVAWAAVKTKYHKDNTGKWVPSR